MAAAFTATIISCAIFGRATIFDIPDLQLLPISYYGIVILVALASGLAGVIFNWGLLNIGRFYSLPCFKRPVQKIAFASSAPVFWVTSCRRFWAAATILLIIWPKHLYRYSFC